MIFNSVTKLGLWHKEYLSFQNPLPLDISIFLDNEKNMGEGSVEKAVKMSVSIIDSCKLFETRK